MPHHRLNIAQQAPLLPVAACLAVGIVVGTHLPTAVPTLWLMAAAVAVTALLGRWPRVQTAGLWLSTALLGMVIAPRQQQRVADSTWTEAIVITPTVEKPRTVMTDLLLTATGEQRRCYISKNAASLGLMPGQRLQVCFIPAAGDADSAATPRRFFFVHSPHWRPDGDGWQQLSSWQRLRIRALLLRQRLLQRYSQFGDDEDAQAVLAAMTLGDKSALSRQLRATYSSTGASHILALSGLHLGIIYLLLSRLTLGRRRWWLTQVLVVLAIWAYALLTGLSPSVVRAAIMISVYALFSLGGRQRAPLGVLSFTAIVMLLADSSALFDVGFQLSFMAMLAILLFMPLFDRYLSSPRLLRLPPLHWLASLMALSMAAQLGTAPLVAYYFGQFSPWFLLTNIIVVPAATLILYGALAALLLPALGTALLWLTGALNTVLTALTTLPGATVSGLHPSALQVVLIYVLVLIVYTLLYRLQPRSRYR